MRMCQNRGMFFTLSALLVLGLCGMGCGDNGGPSCEDVINSCAIDGATQCSGNVVQTCSEDLDGCLAWVDGTNCATIGLICDDSTGSAACSCVDDCTTAGETQCVADVIQTCTAGADGCLDWVNGTDCDATGQVCDDSAEPAVCACEDDCTLAGETQCSGTVIQTCTANIGGCLKWVAGIDCAANSRTCDDTAEPAVCKATCTDLASATGQVGTGSNAAEINDFAGSCGGTDGLDVCFTWVAPAAELYQIDTFGSDYDTVLFVNDASDTEIGCSDDSGSSQSMVAIDLGAGDSITIVVDAYNAAATGTYVLNIAAVPPENVCDDFADNDYDDLWDCADPTDCQGTAACVPGAGAAGDACTANTDCAASANDPACMQDDMGWPGGYCSEWCDLAVPDCPAGSFCMDLGTGGGMGLCIDECDPVADPCRPMFFCCYNAEFDANVCQPDFWECVINCQPNSPADVAEAEDATNNAVYWEWTTPAFIAGPGTAEDTGLTLVNNTAYTIEGTGADNGDDATAASEYVDVDTFLFNAGTADDIYVVLDAAGVNADLDVIITDTSYNHIAGPGRIANGSADTLDGVYEEEFRISENDLYLPGADYLVSVGVYAGSTGLPVDWQLSMCTLSCNDMCIEGNTQCSGRVIQTCVIGTNGCADWEDTTDCATSDEFCDDSAEPAVCIAGTACTDLGSATGAAVATGNNTGAVDEYLGTCTFGSGGLDDCYNWSAPADRSYTIDTCGSTVGDTVLVVYDATGTEIGCDDDTCDFQSEVTLTLTTGQQIKIVVDGFGAGDVGDYVLNIN